MARSRNIKPGFFRNEMLAECSPLARLLFAGLWCLADRFGRLEDRPKRICGTAGEFRRVAIMNFCHIGLEVLRGEVS